MKPLDRGLTIFFMDGTKMTVAFPTQAEDQYQRKLLIEEIIAKRALVIEAEGAVHFVPFDNIKYISVFPAPGAPYPGIIHGARVMD